LGYEPEQLAGKHFSVIMHPDDAALVNRSKALSGYRDKSVSAKDIPRFFDERRADKRKTLGLEVRLLQNKTNASDNEYVYVEVNASGLYIKNIGREDAVFLGTIGIMRDITERKRAEAAIQQMAFYDSVTGLPNRTLFHDRISMALAHAQRVTGMMAVLFLDLDKFKLVNDSLGHAVGDQLLKTVADRLANCTRKGDTVARMGGDEFTLLLPVIKHKNDAEEVADKILEKISHPFVIDGNELMVTTSIGIALYPADGNDIDALLKNADIAMYNAKDTGGNNYKHYTKMLSVKVSRRVVMENELRQAIERKEFFIYYQPRININTGRIVGVEALLRWQHHELGLVFPSEFIPVAEGAGMIVPISEWMLSTVCVQGKTWQSAGLPAVRLAMKLPSHVFQWRCFMETINRVLQETGITPSLLELEITETAMMRNVEVTASRLSMVNALGVKIAIDDFGIGYSSLSCLSSYPIHALKIGKAFVHGITVNPHVESIVKAIIAMAKNLKMSVIAEGVETREQLAFLKEHQCEEA
ncbi:MAG: EAL domain-containing protein, partial [Planctomycetota bacterium]